MGVEAIWKLYLKRRISLSYSTLTCRGLGYVIAREVMIGSRKECSMFFAANRSPYNCRCNDDSRLDMTRCGRLICVHLHDILFEDVLQVDIILVQLCSLPFGCDVAILSRSVNGSERFEMSIQKTNETRPSL